MHPSGDPFPGKRLPFVLYHTTKQNPEISKKKKARVHYNTHLLKIN